MELTAEIRWRNYQQLVWSQQQIHLQIQQQQQQQQQTLQNTKSTDDNGTESHGSAQGSQHQPENTGSEPTEKTVEEKAKEIGDPWENFDAHAAFLGPTLWDKRQCLPYDGQDFKLEYVDLEEFLTENGIPVDESGKAVTQGPGNINSNGQQQMTIAPNYGPGVFFAGPSRAGHGTTPNLKDSKTNGGDNSPRSPSPSCSSSSSNMSGDATPAVSPDSTQPSTAEFASVPGDEFDPRLRTFTEDELKPQPMIKKSRKQFVPDDAKDAKYWVRRRKNNMAAKRSRDARRMKENQIAMRACYLEKENHFVRQELERVQKENTMLKEQLSRYSVDHHH